MKLITIELLRIVVAYVFFVCNEVIGAWFLKPAI